MSGEAGSNRTADGSLEQTIARLLRAVTYVAVALLAVGVVLLLAAGRTPLSGGPPLDLAALPAGVAGLRPEAYLWLGLLAVIAMPSMRVAAATVGYARSGERRMTAVGALVLATIALSVIVALGTEV